MPGRRIVDIARAAEPFRDIAGSVKAGRRRLWVGGLLGSSKFLLAAVLASELPRVWVVIVPTFSDAEHVHDDLDDVPRRGQRSALQRVGDPPVRETLPARDHNRVAGF